MSVRLPWPKSKNFYEAIILNNTCLLQPYLQEECECMQDLPG